MFRFRPWTLQDNKSRYLLPRLSTTQVHSHTCHFTIISSNYNWQTHLFELKNITCIIHNILISINSITHENTCKKGLVVVFGAGNVKKKHQIIVGKLLMKWNEMKRYSLAVCVGGGERGDGVWRYERGWGGQGGSGGLELMAWWWVLDSQYTWTVPLSSHKYLMDSDF